MKLTKLSRSAQMHLTIYGERIRLIQKTVCQFYGITTEQSQRYDNHNPHKKPRQFTHQLCRELLGPGCPLVIIGYVTGTPDRPFDHASVLHSVNCMNKYLFTKTPLDYYAYLDIKNEYQAVRSQVVYALSLLEKPDVKGEGSATAHLGNPLMQRVDRHCKFSGISRSAFIRTAVIEKLKKESNGLPLY